MLVATVHANEFVLLYSKEKTGEKHECKKWAYELRKTHLDRAVVNVFDLESFDVLDSKYPVVTVFKGVDS